MKTMVVGALCMLGSLAHAQDVAKVAPQNCKVKLDNAFIRVVECTLPVGGKDPMHTHPAGWYYVTGAGKMKVSYASGKTETWEPKLGEAAWLEGDPPHTCENVGKTPLAYTLVEVKAAPVKK